MSITAAIFCNDCKKWTFEQSIYLSCGNCGSTDITQGVDLESIKPRDFK